MRNLRRLGVWGVGVLLLLGGSTAARAGSDDGDAAKPAAGASSWVARWLGAAPAPPKKAEKEKLPPKTVTPRHAPVNNEAALVRAREEEALLRRLEVCDKLKQVAERTGDADLGRLADQLDGRARELYFQRIANLPASRATPDLDEYVLDKHEHKSGAEAMPSAPLPHAVPGADDRQADAREEKP